jgi:hypothetical protein
MSRNASIESADVSIARVHSRVSSTHLLRIGGAHKKGHSKSASADSHASAAKSDVGDALLGGMYDDIQYADGGRETRGVRGAGMGIGTVNGMANGEAKRESKGILRKLHLHKP